MSILPTILSNDVEDRERNVSRGDMAYACARFQHQVHNLLVRAIKESGLTQKDLAKLTNIDEASISRLLGRPRNMEINTLSKLIYGANGMTLAVSFAHPQKQPYVLVTPLGAEAQSNIRRYVFNRMSETAQSDNFMISDDTLGFGKMTTVASSHARIKEATYA